jgi:hemoglobin
MKQDLKDRSDIEFLVDTFYKKVVDDQQLKPFFTGALQLDFEHHKPIMVDFWEFILFQTPMKYMRNVMNPHLELNKKMSIKPEHFEVWIALFTEVVDLNFQGEKAEQAKESARTIGLTMQYKIKKFSE